MGLTAEEATLARAQIISRLRGIDWPDLAIEMLLGRFEDYENENPQDQAPILPTWHTDRWLVVNPEVTTSSSTDWQTHLESDDRILRGGTYKLTVSYSWNGNSTSTDFISRLLVDGEPLAGTQDGIMHRQEPKDSAGNIANTGADQQHGFTRVFVVNIETNTAPTTVALQFRSLSENVNVSIWNSLVGFERVEDA